MSNRAVGTAILAAFGLVVAFLVWQFADSAGLAGMVLVAAVIAAAAWDRYREGR